MFSGKFRGIQGPGGVNRRDLSKGSFVDGIDVGGSSPTVPDDADVEFLHGNVGVPFSVGRGSTARTLIEEINSCSKDRGLVLTALVLFVGDLEQSSLDLGRQVGLVNGGACSDGVTAHPFQGGAFPKVCIG